jgi:hypothetical protein
MLPETCHSFNDVKAHLVQQARKAMFIVLRKARKLNLPIDMQLELFDTMVVPIFSMRLVALLPTRLKLQYHLHTVTNINENIQRLHQYQEDVLQYSYHLDHYIDSVRRVYLWQKLLKCTIDGKMFKIIKSMYSNAKYCVRQGNSCSNFFQSNVGERQGENLSPVLFAIFQ